MVITTGNVVRYYPFTGKVSIIKYAQPCVFQPVRAGLAPSHLPDLTRPSAGRNSPSERSFNANLGTLTMVPVWPTLQRTGGV
jgi:hypothetical protein